MLNKINKIPLVLALFLIAVTACASFAAAGATSDILPTSGSSVATAGSKEWSNPESITAADNSAASVQFMSTVQLSSSLVAKGFGFSIPSNAQVLGIELKIKWRCTLSGQATCPYTNIIGLRKIGSANRAVTTYFLPYNTNSFPESTYGGSTDLWGATWSPSDVNNVDFGANIVLKGGGGSGSSTAAVDSVTIKVYYDTPMAADSPVTKSHVDSLRTAVNANRSRVFLTQKTWTDPTITVNQTMVRAVHLNELRTAIEEIYAQCSIAAPSWTDTLTGGSSLIRAVHFTELNDKLNALGTTAPSFGYAFVETKASSSVTCSPRCEPSFYTQGNLGLKCCAPSTPGSVSMIKDRLCCQGPCTADSTAPTVSLTSADATVERTASGKKVVWTLSDSLGGGRYTVKRSGAALGSHNNVYWPSNGVVSVDIDSSATGSFTYRIEYSDAVGNSGTANEKAITVQDTIAPQVTAVAAAVTSLAATITWTTNENGNSFVNYGTTTSLGSSATDAASVTSHSITLHGLSPSTKYYYAAKSCDAAGNCATSATKDFTTTAPIQFSTCSRTLNTEDSFLLTADCSCTGIGTNNCISITSSYAQLDCQSHKMTGSNSVGCKYGFNGGIGISASNVVVKNCVIQDFSRGILLSGSQNTVQSNTVTSNLVNCKDSSNNCQVIMHGIEVYGSSHSVLSNTISNSRGTVQTTCTKSGNTMSCTPCGGGTIYTEFYGILVYGSSNTIKSNSIRDNYFVATGGWGAGGVDWASDYGRSLVQGIRVDDYGSSNTIDGNGLYLNRGHSDAYGTVIDSGWGIRVRPGGSGNVITKNYADTHTSKNIRCDSGTVSGSNNNACIPKVGRCDCSNACTGSDCASTIYKAF
jgi:parallel beta-helix repeat protein